MGHGEIAVVRSSTAAGSLRLQPADVVGFRSKCEISGLAIPGIRKAVPRAASFSSHALTAAPACQGLTFPMIAPETFSHLENIKKRAGYLWRFL